MFSRSSRNIRLEGACLVAECNDGGHVFCHSTVDLNRHLWVCDGTVMVKAVAGVSSNTSLFEQSTTNLRLETLWGGGDLLLAGDARTRAGTWTDFLFPLDEHVANYDGQLTFLEAPQDPCLLTKYESTEIGDLDEDVGSQMTAARISSLQSATRRPLVWRSMPAARTAWQDSSFSSSSQNGRDEPTDSGDWRALIEFLCESSRTYDLLDAEAPSPRHPRSRSQPSSFTSEFARLSMQASAASKRHSAFLSPSPRVGSTASTGITFPPASSSGLPEMTCVICMVEKKNAVFLPCGHVTCCFDCGSEVWSRRGKCPVCRAIIKQYSRIYL